MDEPFQEKQKDIEGKIRTVYVFSVKLSLNQPIIFKNPPHKKRLPV